MQSTFRHSHHVNTKINCSNNQTAKTEKQIEIIPAIARGVGDLRIFRFLPADMYFSPPKFTAPRLQCQVF